MRFMVYIEKLGVIGKVLARLDAEGVGSEANRWRRVENRRSEGSTVRSVTGR